MADVTTKKKQEYPDYESIYGAALGNGNGTGTGSSQSTGNQFDDELAQLAREGNYKAYFNKQIQLANLNRQAERNYQNQQAQQGLTGTGEGSTAGIMLANSYANQHQQNLSDYGSQERQISSDAYSRYQTELANRVGNIQSALQQAAQTAAATGDYSVYQRMLNQYQDEIDGMTGQQANDMNAYLSLYAAQARGSGASDASVANWLTSRNVTSAIAAGEGAADSLKALYVNANNGPQKAGDRSGVSNEIDALTRGVSNSQVKSGDMVLLQGTKSGKGHMWVLYYNGNYYPVTDDDAAAYTGTKKKISGTNPTIDPYQS